MLTSIVAWWPLSSSPSSPDFFIIIISGPFQFPPPALANPSRRFSMGFRVSGCCRRRWQPMPTCLRQRPIIRLVRLNLRLRSRLWLREVGMRGGTLVRRCIGEEEGNNMVRWRDELRAGVFPNLKGNIFLEKKLDTMELEGRNIFTGIEVFLENRFSEFLLRFWSRTDRLLLWYTTDHSEYTINMKTKTEKIMGYEILPSRHVDTVFMSLTFLV